MPMLPQVSCTQLIALLLPVDLCLLPPSINTNALSGMLYTADHCAVAYRPVFTAPRPSMPMLPQVSCTQLIAVLLPVDLCLLPPSINANAPSGILYTADHCAVTYRPVYTEPPTRIHQCQCPSGILYTADHCAVTCRPVFTDPPAGSINPNGPQVSHKQLIAVLLLVDLCLLPPTGSINPDGPPGILYTADHCAVACRPVYTEPPRDPSILMPPQVSHTQLITMLLSVNLCLLSPPTGSINPDTPSSILYTADCCAVTCRLVFTAHHWIHQS